MDPTQIPLVVAAAVAILTLFVPFLTARMIRNSARADKKADAELAAAAKKLEWDREDLVASKAEAAAARNASLIAELNRSTSEASRIQIGKIDVVHTLVNSTLTAAMQLALDGARRELVLMERDPLVDQVMVGGTRARIVELEKIIHDRNKRTAVAELQDQQVEAIRAGEAVGVMAPSKIPPLPVQELGSVTDSVLRGDPVPTKKFETVAEAEVAAEAATEARAAALATVDAASATVDAAAATVETMKKNPL